jgi:hypothetical protein
MPDILKCTNINCPLKESCWRFVSPPSEYRQSYTSFNFKWVGTTVTCDGFWRVPEDKKK